MELELEVDLEPIASEKEAGHSWKGKHGKTGRRRYKCEKKETDRPD